MQFQLDALLGISPHCVDLSALWLVFGKLEQVLYTYE